MTQFYCCIRPEFRALIHAMARVDVIATNQRWAEGPVWFADAQTLIWSDIPNDRMMRWTWDLAGPGTVSVFRSPAQHANGNTRDRQGRLVTCEHGGRRIVRTEIDGAITVLCDSHQGVRLNSPNDVVTRSDGSIWFTDPTYGLRSAYQGARAPQMQNARHIFKLSPAGGGEPQSVMDDFEQPNGLAFSPDETILYAVDSGLSHRPDGPHHIRRLHLDSTGCVTGHDLFAVIEPGAPDGLCVDELGHVWTSAGDGVHCFSPDGTLIGKLLFPEPISNLCFGGPMGNRLFVTGATCVYALFVAVRGAQGW